jgi:PAS domain S-box-containing protein
MVHLIEKIKSFKDMFEQFEYCVFVTDLDRLIVYMNPAFIKFTGHSYNEMLYETSDTFLKGNSIQLKESLVDDQLIILGEINHTMRLIFLKNANLDNRVMRILKTPIFHEKKIIGILGIAEDVTDHYRLHYIGIEKTLKILSRQERFILFQYSRGMSRAEISRSLKISSSSVDTVWYRIRDKLKLSAGDFEVFMRFYSDLIDNIYTD